MADDSKLQRLKQAELQTPAFVFDVATMRADARTSRSIVRDTSTALLFAMKSFSMAAGLRAIAEEVDGFAVSSLFEARLARDILQPEQSVHLTTPGLRADELHALRGVVDYVSFNSLSQWQRSRVALNGDISYGLRVNPQLSFVEDARYDPCRDASKLGVPLDELQHLVLHSPDMFRGIEGLQVHSNCDSRDLAPLLATVERLLEALDPLLDQLRWINLGGGYLLNDAQHVEALAEARRRLLARGDFRLFIEPGAAIVRRAGYMVASVVDLFTSGGQQIAVLDTSVNHMPEVFEYQFEPDVAGEDEAGEYEYLLAGSACLAGDLFGVYGFAEPLAIGSRVIFPNMGAYSLVKANMFNGINLPSIYLLSDEGELEKVTQFTYADFQRLCGE